jgi:hypothetical protein
VPIYDAHERHPIDFDYAGNGLQLLKASDVPDKCIVAVTYTLSRYNNVRPGMCGTVKLGLSFNIRTAAVLESEVMEPSIACVQPTVFDPRLVIISGLPTLEDLTDKSPLRIPEVDITDKKKKKPKFL